MRGINVCFHRQISNLQKNSKIPAPTSRGIFSTGAANLCQKEQGIYNGCRQIGPLRWTLIHAEKSEAAGAGLRWRPRRSEPLVYAMSDQGILLCAAPERYFDSAKWNEYCSHYESREAALRELSTPEPPGILGVFRQLVAKQPGPAGEEARRYERADQIGKSIVAEFKERLIRGGLIATGFSSLAIERVRIPGERWSDLWLNFIENSADGSDLKFTSVRIVEPPDPSSRGPDLLDRCVDWLQKRSQEGESRRKVLLTEALAHFGPELTTRTFGAAYKKTFSKPRGRPRGNRSK